MVHMDKLKKAFSSACLAEDNIFLKMGKILKYWPKEEIIKALQSLPKDEPINKKTLFKYYKQKLICWPGLISSKFSTIINACNVAGVKCNALYGKEKTEYMAKLNTKYTKQNLLEIVKNNYKKNSKLTPTQFISKYNKDNNFDIRGAIGKYFGNYKNLFKEADVNYRNYYWTDKKIIKTLKDLNNKYGPLLKRDINRFRRKKLICGAKLIRDRFGSVVKAAKLADFKFFEPQDVNHKFNGKIGKKETVELDRIERIYNIKLLRQYRIEIDSKIYFIDGYDKKNNIAYEIDDNCHKYDKQKILDKKRQSIIMNKLKCNFIRIKIY